MSLVRRLAVGFVSAVTLCSAGAQERPRFCIVPVQNGTPTDKDVGDAWRMASKVVMLPGVPRPVIYAYNRGGVWTIDQTRSFVPFGGEFPANPLMDSFVRDPDTGRIVGIDRFPGVFALDPGDTQFKKLHAAGDKETLRHPYSIEFIPRFKGYVIADANGLFLLDREGHLSLLPVSDRAVLLTPFRTFDLPAFGALLINAKDSQIVIRFDDGEVVKATSLDRGDYPSEVTVLPDGTLSVRGNKRSYTVRLGRALIGPVVQRQSFAVEPAKSIMRLNHFDASRLGPALQRLPFDPDNDPIEALSDMPESKATLIFTKASAYALEDSGAITEVAGARTTGRSLVGVGLGIIPVRNEMIVLGGNALYLLLDTRFAGATACRAPG